MPDLFLDLQGYHGVKPGWTRVSFAYYLPREEFQFILAAIDFVAAHGHRFLPLYNFDWATGNWTFRRRAIKHHLMIGELLHDHGNCTTEISGDDDQARTDLRDKFDRCLEFATKVAMSLPDTCGQQQVIPEGIDPDIVLFRV
jgi:hypothetical protein